jgi:hypothetical protein
MSIELDCTNPLRYIPLRAQCLLIVLDDSFWIQHTAELICCPFIIAFVMLELYMTPAIVCERCADCISDRPIPSVFVA